MKTQHHLLDTLDTLGVDVAVHEHPAVYTVEEAQQHCSHIRGCHCKNLFLKTKKKKYWLVVLKDDTRVDLKTLAAITGAGSWSFASPERLMERLGVKPGAVTPFSLINDTDGQVRLAVEKQILDAPTANFHPMVNTATVNISAQGLLTFFKHTGHEPMLIDCS